MTGAHALAATPEMMSPVDAGEGAPMPDDKRLAQVMAHVPGCAHKSFVSSALPGGLTNRNYRVQTADGRSMVVRLSSTQSALVTIDRDDEYVAAAAAATAGVGPAVLAYVPELSALVIEWIDGRTFAEADLDDSATLLKVAQTCRQLHSGPRFASDFDMFALRRRYLDLVLKRGFRLPSGYLDFEPAVAQIEAAMAVRAEPTVPCHNDLLPANLMADAHRLWFIDFEYAGNGDPCFELGNLCSEAHLDPHRLEELVAAYYGPISPAQLAGKVARAQLQALMSNYGWTLWACIQSATSELDFDFWDWGLEKYERAVATFLGPELSRLIQDVRQP